MSEVDTVRVVIGEDDARIAEIQQRFTEQLPGFEVVGLSHTLEQTAQLVEILQPELLLLDIQFPDGNGLEYLKKMREQKLTTDVILITAARDIETLKTAMHGGIFDYIVKPIVFDRFHDSLNRYQQHMQRIRSLSDIDQKMVDSLLPRGGSDSGKMISDSVLPKGIDALTLNKIQSQFMDQGDSLAASSVGSAVGVSRTTARRYLEYLVSSGELQVDVNYGGVGRPERYYCRARPA